MLIQKSVRLLHPIQNYSIFEIYWMNDRRSVSSHRVIEWVSIKPVGVRSRSERPTLESGGANRMFDGERRRYCRLSTRRSSP